LLCFHKTNYVSAREKRSKESRLDVLWKHSKNHALLLVSLPHALVLAPLLAHFVHPLLFAKPFSVSEHSVLNKVLLYSCKVLLYSCIVAVLLTRLEYHVMWQIWMGMESGSALDLAVFQSLFLAQCPALTQRQTMMYRQIPTDRQFF
jgi:hypothetical protein